MNQMDLDVIVQVWKGSSTDWVGYFEVNQIKLNKVNILI